MNIGETPTSEESRVKVNEHSPAMTPLENRNQIDLKRARRLETAPASCRGILARAWAGTSRKTAIAAMCLECVGFDRAAVTECTGWACPLWAVRPYQKEARP